MVIKAVNLEGQQEILAVEPMENESEETYSALFRRLQERGLEKVWLCVSDAHKGFRLRYETPYLGLHGRDARFISCGIFLHMFRRKIRRKLPRS